MRTDPPPLLPIFRSQAQARLLTELFVRDGAGEPRLQRELAAAANVPQSNATRELRRLVDAGLVQERRVGRQRLLSPNPDSPYYRPLRELLEVAFGAPHVLREAMRDLTGIVAVAIYGSYAARLAGESGPPPRDIDVLIVGTVDMRTVMAAVRAAEAQLRREVNPTVLSVEEWTSGDSGFLRQLRRGPLRVLVGALPASGPAPSRGGLRSG